MATWFLIPLLSLSFTFLLRHFLRRKTSPLPLPPNPNFFPFLGPLRWLRQGYGDINSYLRSIHHRLGPIVSLRVIFFPAIFVSDRFLAHKALVLNGAVFSDRPPALPTGKIITSNQHTISSGSYGATWRLLRRNLTSEILHPSRLRDLTRNPVALFSERKKQRRSEKMKYLKAVVLEGLRRHPPGHLLLPHRVSEDTELGGYRVPKKRTVNFNVAEKGRDPTVWEEPMEFKPVRFVGEGEETEEVDIIGSRGIKMIPFGAGRRICPGIAFGVFCCEFGEGI